MKNLAAEHAVDGLKHADAQADNCRDVEVGRAQTSTSGSEYL
jgi:hypothetical protein